MPNKIQSRRDTAAVWAAVNPVLADGEIGLETDTRFMKFGDGSTPWNGLGYVQAGPTSAPAPAPSPAPAPAPTPPTAPTITTQPSAQSVTAPTAATFTVAASGTAPLAYQWRKNGSALSGATSASYTTPATTTADSGATFDVVVTNAAGSVTSSAVALTVSSSAVAPAFTAAPYINGTPQVGVASSYTSGTATGTPTPTLTGQWLIDGAAITGATGATYTPVSSDAGKVLSYRQTATNSAGTANSTSAGVTVAAAAPAPAPAPTPPDTRPRYWYGPASDFQAANIAAAFAGATPLPGSANGGKTGGPWTPTPTASQYIWIAALSSAGDITVTESLGSVGFNGAGSAGDFTGTETSPSTSSITYVHSSGTYDLYRSNFTGQAGTPYTLI